jgi:ubiquinone biosynthesis protein
VTSRPPRQERPSRIERSIDRALGNWRSGRFGIATSVRQRRAAGSHSANDRPLPTTTQTSPLRSVTGTACHAGVIHTAGRLILWSLVGLYFYLGILFDKTLRRDSLARRATRLRGIFERLGSTFVKVAQQLAIRADVLPLEYTEELSKLLDTVPPFDVAIARRMIERVIAAPIDRVFAEFDPQPIGSASIACVYKARLHTGETVAVKVRRPGIDARLAADVRALGWILQAAEWAGVFKPEFTRTLRTEFGRMLFEEVDFYREARNTEIFRAEAIRGEQSYITAPRVHFALSGEDVLVTDFVTGVFLKDILRALDERDEIVLARVRDEGIDLPEVARRLVMSAHWELLESLLFHADPHPANICVQSGNTLVFIDFGSCGRITGRYRRIWQRFYHELTDHNVQQMVQTALAILEPLPPINVEDFSREIELMFWDWVYAMNSDHSEWWEKASGVLWMKFADAARRYQAPMSSEIVRIFRATFLYDTMIFRLWNSLDMKEEFKRYRNQAGRRTKRRIRREFWRRVEKGLTNSDYLEIDDLWHLGRQIVGRMQHYMDTPAPNFAREIGKLSYAFILSLRTGAFAIAAVALLILVSSAHRLATGQPLNIWSRLVSLSTNPWLQVGFAVMVLLMIRKTIKKLQEPDLD